LKKPITGSCVQWACPTAQPAPQAHRNTRAKRCVPTAKSRFKKQAHNRL